MEADGYTIVDGIVAISKGAFIPDSSYIGYKEKLDK
jgi:hypothetical protein